MAKSKKKTIKKSSKPKSQGKLQEIGDDEDTIPGDLPAPVRGKTQKAKTQQTALNFSGNGSNNERSASLRDEAQRRYLTYAMSVITSRALPDVRDGLKPVQRRILFTMHKDLHLKPEGPFVKSARVVGEVMGKYHPHGDTAIYDAMVRLAQSFSLRVPLISGRGNFGSADGDSAAAMRYTESKLAQPATELLTELEKNTVDFRPNYDGSEQEPSVLPARIPNLLINGAQGIAVGMATSIPPHNPIEVIDACIAMIDEPDIGTKALTKIIKGPDLPTGGQLLASKRDLDEAYEAGHGTIKMRATWKVEDHGKSTGIIINSIPYAIERRTIVERIAQVIIEKKMPLLLDVRDESTEETRIVLELKKDADPDLVMAYLCKHTPVESTLAFNFTCLIPKGPSSENQITTPIRLSLPQMLKHFLDFRMEVVVKRLNHDLEALKKRIHILEGLITIFDALDETIRIIRKSEGKADAAQKLMARFKLSAEQVDAILELKLYRLAKLEILVLQQELDAKKKEAAGLQKLLSHTPSRWKLIKSELEASKLVLSGKGFESKRLTKIAQVQESEFTTEDFIVEEDATVLLSAQGWIKRQGRVKDLSTSRTREGDAILDAAFASTKASVALFSSRGVCYVLRTIDVPPSTGYGTPVQSLLKLADGEKIIRMLSFDPRMLDVPAAEEGATEPVAPFAIGVSKRGQVLMFSLSPHRDPSTKAGRKYARPSDGDEMLYVGVISEKKEKIACVSKKGSALICLADEVPVVSGPAKGVRLIKLADDDSLLAARLSSSREDITVKHDNGKELTVSFGRDCVSRGGKGTPLFKKGQLISATLATPVLPEFEK